MSDDLRQRYADAIGASRVLRASSLEIADAVLAVRDEEMGRLRAVELVSVCAHELLIDAEAAITRVRRKHAEVPHRPGYCYCGNPSPCPTIRALDGEEA